MKKLFVAFLLLLMVVCFALAGCKTEAGDRIAAVTGIGDGKVSIVESVVIKAGVKVSLAGIPTAAKPAIHIIADGILAKLDTNDAATLVSLNASLEEVVSSVEIDDAEILEEVNALIANLKADIISQLNITDEAEQESYLVGIRAIIQEIADQTI